MVFQVPYVRRFDQYQDTIYAVNIVADAKPVIKRLLDLLNVSSANVEMAANTWDRNGGNILFFPNAFDGANYLAVMYEGDHYTEVLAIAMADGSDPLPVLQQQVSVLVREGLFVSHGQALTPADDGVSKDRKVERRAPYRSAHKLLGLHTVCVAVTAGVGTGGRDGQGTQFRQRMKNYFAS